jgi:hypothetical protein
MEEKATNWERIPNCTAVVLSLAKGKHVISPTGIFVRVILGFKLLFHFCPFSYYAVSISE